MITGTVPVNHMVHERASQLGTLRQEHIGYGRGPGIRKKKHSGQRGWSETVRTCARWKHREGGYYVAHTARLNTTLNTGKTTQLCVRSAIDLTLPNTPFSRAEVVLLGILILHLPSSTLPHGAWSMHAVSIKDLHLQKKNKNSCLWKFYYKNLEKVRILKFKNF